MLTAEQIATFHRTGFLRIPGLFAGDELTQLQSAARTVEADGLARTGSGHLYRTTDTGEQAYFRSENMWTRHAVFRAATVHPRLLMAIGQVTGHPFIPWNDSLVSKQPHTPTPIEFHQDPPYYDPQVTRTSGIPDFVTDIYLAPSTIANGCVHGVPGKHLLGTIDLSRYSEDQLFRDCGAVPIEMNAGDVLFHALSAPHGSRANTTDSTRTTFYLKYLAEGVDDWKDPSKRNMSRDAAGIEKIRGFISDRQALGFDAALGPDLVLNDRGFEWHGEPRTGPYYWDTLAAHMSDEERKAARQLSTAT